VKKSKEDAGRQIRRRKEKEDPVEAELVSRIGREECVCIKVKKKSCGQNRMEIGLRREESLRQT